MARRTGWNFGLDRAIELALEYRRPLVVLEALRCDYPWASDRLHRFVIEGMADNARALHGRRVCYYPYVEPARRRGRGLVRALATQACAIVTDWYPAFFLPRMLDAASRQVPVRIEAVDSNGLAPISEHGRAFPTARAYRAYMQRTLRTHIAALPDPAPLSRLARLPRPGALSRTIINRWPPARIDALLASPDGLSALPIDHRVPPVPIRGGSRTARRTLRRFVRDRLASYADDHRHPDADGSSHLSPYLHFGHISTHEVFSAVMTKERWTTRRLSASGGGAREGWWGVSDSAEAFLDQLVVWRELAFNAAAWTTAFETYGAIPAWARDTLEHHGADPRPYVYSLRALETASTHDTVWNAVQRQLVRDGWFHGQLRMLWGKKILEWCSSPKTALDHMEALMNRYALDGRDPVSYAGFSWILGKYDRPWPERPIFGTVRCMTSSSALRKLRMKKYLSKYGPRAAG
jgi:deoxyribodipyrimidine photo-lyase